MNFLRGTTEEFKKYNPVLEDGQPGFERVIEKDIYGNIVKGSEIFKLKIGDGITHWNDLPYISSNNSSESENSNKWIDV